ncbi:MAG: hypothetical protein ACPGJS_17885 [Flammeovirgaceae bacterium]
MKTFIWFALAFLLFACTPKQESCKQVSSAEAEKVVKDYFIALQERDFEKLHALSTKDYILFDQGFIWNNDSIINVFLKKPTLKINYELKDFNTQTDCNSAFVSYLNYGVIHLGDTSYNKNWTESAAVRRVDGEVKLAFLHSTAMK